MGNEAGKIYELEKRMPSIEEIKEMSREAFLYAEKVLKQTKIDNKRIVNK